MSGFGAALLSVPTLFTCVYLGDLVFLDTFRIISQIGIMKKLGYNDRSRNVYKIFKK